MALSPPLLALLITIFTVLIAVTTLVATFAGRQSELALSLSDEISRRKCTEEDLRRSEVYFAEAQRLSHTGSWAFNVATRAVRPLIRGIPSLVCLRSGQRVCQFGTTGSGASIRRTEKGPWIL